ncbi:MAG TPA: hypothetical protein VK958_01730 [Methylophilus sp.]|uniref:hypothetical protein n=1 Tax=Methylophilus sp. TaxID=29541 RepID=UPI002C043249|nr:hypothetical protein [Methylophilus sp.]HSH85946.1 hypothetical protein [Methylophilus sp.]
MNTEAQSKDKPSCFVVMPFGRDSEEQKWFKGWYEVVLSPAIHASGYLPVLSAGEEQPGAINDEIRAHLAYDPMVLVDLGGFEREDDPNPNVMYELGIRHALGLPLVIMAWEGQRLPFDVSNQRVIMHDRDFMDIEINKKKIVAFIQAAAEGKFYRPMDAVGRMAAIAAASENLGEDSILAALIQEVKELKGSVNSVVHSPRAKIEWETTLSIKTLLREKDLRKTLYVYFVDLGGTSAGWGKIIRKRISVDFAQTAYTWQEDEWKKYIAERFAELPPPKPPKDATALIEATINTKNIVDESLIEKVLATLPPQPWPSGTHRTVMSTLGITSNQYKRAVVELTKRGLVKEQIDGVLINIDL